MATEPIPEFTQKDLGPNEGMEETLFARRGCCCWVSCFGCERSNSVWERIKTVEKEESDWFTKGLKALKKGREWSEVVAGPRWKTFIRRFNKNRVKQGKFQYDPMSYSLNFDDGPGMVGLPDDDRAYRDFSARYALIPISAKSTVDSGKEGLLFTSLDFPLPEK